MVRGVREGFEAVRALGYPVRPFSLKLLFQWMPQSYAASYWRRFFAAPAGDIIFGRHARCAAIEMQALAADCRTLLPENGAKAPSLLQLYDAIDNFAATAGAMPADPRIASESA